MVKFMNIAKLILNVFFNPKNKLDIQSISYQAKKITCGEIEKFGTDSIKAKLDRKKGKVKVNIRERE